VLNKRCIDIALAIYFYPKYEHTNIIRNPVKLDIQRNICVKKTLINEAIPVTIRVAHSYFVA